MTIDLAALRHNLGRIRQFAPGRRVIAIVKANAYGHGVARIAQALPDVEAWGVASLDEALHLRNANITQPIILLEGVFSAHELSEAARQQLTLVIHHEAHIEFLAQAVIKEPLSVWLKINTGMHRLGIAPADVQKTYQRLLSMPAIKKPIGLMTHFAEADNLESQATLQQIKYFNHITSSLKGPCTLANSAAILKWPAAHGDWIRPGLILYGASPFMNQTGLDHDLQAVMTLSSRLIAITQVKKGGKVGYGGTWVAPEDLFVGVVGIGYGDGYPQFAENGTPVLVNGIECPLVGRVSMDMLTVDLRRYREAQVGDAVILWGVGLPVERVARYCHSSAYELLTKTTSRPIIEIKDG